MADPDFLNRRLTVKIHPALVFLNSMKEMMKLAERAVLIVREGYKVQILSVVPNQGSSIILDMESDLIVAPSNSDGYSLLFRLENWFHCLSDYILLEPTASLYIMKSPVSNDLFCIFGTCKHLIKLEDAQFVISQAVDMSNNDVFVRVIMSAEHFRHFIEDFAEAGHDDSLSAVQMSITSETIRWITPLGHYDHSTEDFIVEGLAEGARFQFGLRWDWELFGMLCSMSNDYDTAVISVFEVPGGLNLYGFWFSVHFQSYFAYYMENELVLADLF